MLFICVCKKIFQWLRGSLIISPVSKHTSKVSHGTAAEGSGATGAWPTCPALHGKCCSGMPSVTVSQDSALMMTVHHHLGYEIVGMVR